MIIVSFFLKDLHVTYFLSIYKLFFLGPISISVPVDKNNKHMGHGIITFKEKSLAELAFHELKKTSFKGQMLPYSGPANRDPPAVRRTR